MYSNDATTDRDRDGDRNPEAVTVKIGQREAAQLIEDPGLPCDGAELHLPGLHTRPLIQLNVYPTLPEAAIACLAPR